jgi:hypothetical protein
MEGATQLQSGDWIMRPANVSAKAVCSVILSPSAGSHTYKLTALRAAGTGNITMAANSLAPAFILVEDIGAV